MDEWNDTEIHTQINCMEEAISTMDNWAIVEKALWDRIRGET